MAKADVIKEIKQLGGVVQETWPEDALVRQLNALRTDLHARHENMEDVAELYPSHSRAKELGAVHKQDVNDMKKHGVKAPPGFNRTQVQSLLSAHRAENPPRPVNDE